MKGAAIVVATTAALLTAVAGAQQRPAAIEVLPVRGQVYLLASAAGNALLQVGADGVLVVDTMRQEDADRLLTAIKTVAGDRPIRFVVNTHAHADHTGGNLTVAGAGSQLIAGNFSRELGEAGARSAFIVAHENVLNSMSAPTGTKAPTPFGAWPTDTFFQAEKDCTSTGRHSAPPPAGRSY